MARRPRPEKSKAAGQREFRSLEYNGHIVVFPANERQRRIFIDERPVLYGRVGDQYYLSVYAYEPGDTLEAVIKSYLNYKDKVLELRNRE